MRQKQKLVHSYQSILYSVALLLALANLRRRTYFFARMGFFISSFFLWYLFIFFFNAFLFFCSIGRVYSVPLQCTTLFELCCLRYFDDVSNYTFRSCHIIHYECDNFYVLIYFYRYFYIYIYI